IVCTRLSRVSSPTLHSWSVGTAVLCISLLSLLLFFFTDTAPPEIYTLSLHDALPIWTSATWCRRHHVEHDIHARIAPRLLSIKRSEEHTSELQSRFDLVCRLLLEKKKKNTTNSAEMTQ